MPGPQLKLFHRLNHFDRQAWHKTFSRSFSVLKRILFFPDPSDGGDPSDPKQNPSPPAPPAAPAPGDAPKAAETVLNGDRTERVVELEERLAKREQELEDEKAGRKKDQVRVSELEDENHRLKQVPTPPAPAKRDNSFHWPGYNV